MIGLYKNYMHIYVYGSCVDYNNCHPSFTIALKVESRLNDIVWKQVSVYYPIPSTWLRTVTGET